MMNLAQRYRGPKNFDPTMTVSQIAAYTPNASANISIPIVASRDTSGADLTFATR
jgi:hypothetical protein